MEAVHYQTPAILVIFLVERIISHRYLVEQNRIQKTNNFLSHHYKILDRIFNDLDEEITATVKLLKETSADDYSDYLAKCLDKIKALNNTFHFKIIIPYGSIDNSTYSFLNRYSNDFIDTITSLLDSNEKISIINPKDVGEIINWYKSRVYALMHKS